MLHREPLGHELEFTLQHRIIVRRELGGRVTAAQLQGAQRTEGFPIEHIGAGTILQGCKILFGAEVLQQHETARLIDRVHGRDMQADLGEQTRNVQVRADVLAIGRGIHDDEAVPVSEMGAEIAAKTRVCRGHGDPLEAMPEFLAHPAGEDRQARIGSGHEICRVREGLPL